MTATRVFRTTVFLNVDQDNFFGYRPDALVADSDVALVVAAESVEAAANLTFEVGNRMAADANGTRWPSDVRSVSVGDLIRVIDDQAHQSFLSVDSFGFTAIPEPTNPRRPLAGTRATSRS